MSLRNTILAISIALMGSIFMLDCASGRDIDPWPLYLLPIGLASFALGARYGYALTVVAGLLLLAASGVYNHAIPTLSAFMNERGTEASVFVICAYLVGLLRLAVAGADGRGPIDTPTQTD